MARSPRARKGKKRRRGRPAIAEDAARFQAATTAIVSALAAGNYLETAAAYAGVSKQTIYTWLRQGARDEAAGVQSLHRDFLDAVKKAEAEAEVAGIAAITQAARDRTIEIPAPPAGKGQSPRPPEVRVIPGSWQALAWRLERRDPARWGRRSPGPAPATPPPPPAGDEVAPESAREKLLKALEGIRERKDQGAEGAA